MFTVQDALELVIKAFADKTDKSGKYPAVFHSIAVAAEFDDPIDQMIALLHDILEDTEANKHTLFWYGVPNEVIDHVIELTRTDAETYFDYIDRINSLRSIRIKMADITHNFNRSWTLPDQKEAESLKLRYRKAFDILLKKEQALYDNT